MYVWRSARARSFSLALATQNSNIAISTHNIDTSEIITSEKNFDSKKSNAVSSKKKLKSNKINTGWQYNKINNKKLHLHIKKMKQPETKLFKIVKN